MPIAPGLIALYTVSNGLHFDQFRAIDILLLLAVGLCSDDSIKTFFIPNQIPQSGEENKTT